MNKDDFILEITQGVDSCINRSIAEKYPNHVIFSQDKIKCHIYSKSKSSENNFFLHASYNMYNFSFSEIEDKIKEPASGMDISGIIKDYPYVSFVFANADKIIYKPDYWGIFPYFYYRDDHCFVVSNNLFELARVLNKEQDIEALYETLFFNSTRDSKTFFKDISLSLPNQAFTFDLKNGKLTMTERNKYDELFNTEGSMSIKAAYEKFFEKAKTSVENPALSLSSGSDSRTILACLWKYQLKPKIYSWGDKIYVERQKIEKLAKDFKIDVNYINFQSFDEDSDQELLEGLSLSNGYLAATHFMHFYKRIPTPVNLFEGFLGSEFIKAALSDGMISPPFEAVIAKNMTISQAMDKYFGDFDPTFRKNMETYLANRFGHEFVDINDDKNYQNFLQYAFSFCPAKKFSGICQLARNLGIYQYLPYLDLDILRATYHSGFGLAHYCSSQKKFPGDIAEYKPEAVVVKSMNYKLYRSELGTNVSMLESLEYPLQLTQFIKKIRCFRDKYLYKNCFTGQVNYNKINRHIAEKVNNLGLYKQVVSKQTEFKYSVINNFLYDVDLFRQLVEKE